MPALTEFCDKRRFSFQTIFSLAFCTIFDVKIGGRIRGRYAERPKTGLSLLKSMVPAGGIEPTA